MITPPSNLATGPTARYRVTHRTRYEYGEAVPLCHNLLRLRPRQTDRQRLVSYELALDPRPADRRDRTDFFGNAVTFFTVQEPHQAMTIEARSVVEVTAPPPPEPAEDDAPWPTREQAVAYVRSGLDPVTLDARSFTFPSPLVPVSEAFAAYAGPSFPPGTPLHHGAADLCRRIYEDFTFDPRATTVSTPVTEVLEKRRGVCQDFAHLALACLRSIGLPARYVSGYLVTRPPPGKPRLVGADASHAWLAVFVPGPGWIDLDPTNGLLPGNEHITTALGRDYDDIAPVKGVLTGGPQHTLKYSVDVEPLD